MKGITHFVVGVAAASCFPEAVRAGASGNPLYFLLGGCFGLLPDTLDFRFGRFLYRHDIEVAPDPNRPDPQAIADAVAGAAHRAHDSGRPQSIKLQTIRLGTDRWQGYEVFFDVPHRKVEVRYGPVVDTGGNPVAPAPGGRQGLKASAPLLCDIKLDYQAVTTIDIFDGPVYRMERCADGRVAPLFIPWHRSWSHSLVIGLLFGLIAGLAWGPLAGGIAFAGLAAHVAADQAGYMGSNLFFPFTRRRRPGWKTAHSTSAGPNFAVVWLSCLLIFWNLYRAEAAVAGTLSVVRLFVFGAALPALLLALLRRAMRARPLRSPGRP